MNSRRCSNLEDSQDLYGEVRVNIEFDPNNLIDREIRKQIQEYKENPPYWSENVVIQRVLHKQFAYNQYSTSMKRNRKRIDDAIEIGIKRRIEKTGMSRQNVIRFAFCLHFDIPFHACED